MKNIEIDQLMQSEEYDVKYMEELRDYWNAYSFALINEIYVGVGINLGLSESEAYKLAKNDPKKLEKANFFKDIFEKMKSIFKHKIPKFRYKKPILKDNKPMTQKQWEDFNKKIDEYWSKNSQKVAEDLGIKSYMLGRKTTEFREKDQSYKNKSLSQVAENQFADGMPENISDAYKKYDFKNYEKNIINKSLSEIGMYVSRTGNDIKEAIRQNIQVGIDNNKSPQEVASDLYWEVEKNENLNNPYTAESMRKNWNRIATTEMAMAYEAGILAPYEGDAMESLKDPEMAQYFVRTGGSCDWCMPRRGTIARMVPSSIVVDQKDESLSRMGIKDPNTDIAIWVGKNNIGLKRNDWLLACPAHPHNTATFQPIDLKNEYYNEKTDDVERRLKEKKFVPKQKDYTYKGEKDIEDRKAKFVDTNLVRFNNNIYESVSPEDYNKKLDEWKKNPMNPIPINKKSPSYDRIFGSAEK